nr:hypothetical protein [Evansella caseinilytica]
MYNEQIAAREKKISSLSQENVTLQSHYVAVTSRIAELERKLETLLSYRNAIDKELAALEFLTDGAGSPMGRIKFLKPGILESKALTMMEERVAERRKRQATALDSVAFAIERMDKKARAIEDEIEWERTRAASYGDMISSNSTRINNLREVIASRRSSIRSL